MIKWAPCWLPAFSVYSDAYSDIDKGDGEIICFDKLSLKRERWSSTVAEPDSISAVVGGFEGDSESIVHLRFRLLINGLGIRAGLGGRFPAMILFVVVVEFMSSPKMMIGSPAVIPVRDKDLHIYVKLPTKFQLLLLVYNQPFFSWRPKLS